MWTLGGKRQTDRPKRISEKKQQKKIGWSLVLQIAVALQFVRKNKKHGKRDYKALFPNYGIGNDDDNDDDKLIKYQFKLPVRLPFTILCLSL